MGQLVNPTALVKYNAARYALQECARVDEAKSILDKVEALRAYARQQKDIDMECWLAELKLRARRKIGEISSQLDTAPGKRTDVEPLPSAGKRLKKEVLKEAEISIAVAGRCEQIADIDVVEFEAVITEAKEKKKPVTYSDVEKVVRKKERKKKQQAKEDAAAAAAPDPASWLTNDQSIVQCDVLITDPPYGILDEEWDDIEIEAFTRGWLSKWNECGADIFISTWSQRYLFSGRVWFDESLTNYQYQQLLIWHYPNNKSPQSRLGFKHTFEPIFLYRKTKSTKQIGVGGGSWGDGLNDFDCHVSAMPQSNFNDQNMKQHPAQKSVAIMRWLINATTSKGDLVVDPFCGSGTTGIAALQLGRSFHGIEINDDYLGIATRRISAYG